MPKSKKKLSPKAKQAYQQGRALTIARGKYLQKKKNVAVGKSVKSKQKRIRQRLVDTLSYFGPKEDVNLSGIRFRKGIGRRTPKVTSPNWYGQKKL